MGPIILLDKSTLQSLNYDEIFILNRYYYINITPIIIIEILGDLKKSYKNNVSPQKKVIELTNKIVTLDSSICINYKTLLINSLLGNKMPMHYSIPVRSGRDVVSENGQKGMIFEESSEEKMLTRWKIGQFNKFENDLSEQWRNISRKFDLDHLSKKFKSINEMLNNIKNLNTLLNSIETILNNLNLQTYLLKFIIEEFNIEINQASKIWHRWESQNYNTIKNFAPYAYYCIKANFLFYLAILNNLIGTKATNKIDFEYLYYLPFTMIFSSNDKIHLNLAPLLLSDEQDFINGIKFKSDLNQIFIKWKNLPDSEKQKVLNNQIDLLDNDSITYNLYKKYTIAKKGESGLKISKEKEKEIIDYINNLRKKSKPLHKNNDCNQDFIIKKRIINNDDLCPCGSGKSLKDCHLKNKS